jgi:hypothetical protein
MGMRYAKTASYESESIISYLSDSMGSSGHLPSIRCCPLPYCRRRRRGTHPLRNAGRRGSPATDPWAPQKLVVGWPEPHHHQPFGNSHDRFSVSPTPPTWSRWKSAIPNTLSRCPGTAWPGSPYGARRRGEPVRRAAQTAGERAE